MTYNPVAETVTHELFEGSNASGSPVDTITLANERLSAGAYRIGFHADLDTDLASGEKSYFTYLEISEGPVDTVTRVFRALHFPHRRREVVSAEDPTPINVQPGEMLYDAEENKLYAGLEDTTTVEIVGGGGSIGGGNPFDQDLNTTDSVTFTSVAFSNGTQVTAGSFDSGIGGQNGIALHCYLGYELNWQGGHLRNVYINDTSGTPQTITCDSPIAFPGEGTASMQIDNVGLTFPNGSTQSVAGITSNATDITGAAAITNIVSLSQAAYDALVTKNATTLYIING